MEEKFYTCKYDRPFKEIMLDEKNKDILKALLECMLKIKIEKIEIKPTERNTGNLKVKRKIFDALLYTSEGKIGIEVNSHIEDYVRPRNMAYISDVYANHTLIGDTYDEDTMIIQINLTYGLYKIGDEKEYRIYYMQDEEGKLFVKNLKIIEYNMDYYKKIWQNKNEKLIEKNKFLVMLDLELNDLKKLSQTNRMVSKYMEKLENINMNPEFREYMSKEEDERKIRNSREKYFKDYEKKIHDKEEQIKDKEEQIKDKEQQINDKEQQINDKEQQIKDKEQQINDKEQQINNKEQQIFEKEKKLKEKQDDIVKAMFNKNFSIEEIMTLTGLTKEEIEKLI